jgi:radical SAM superfamily enzyme YgiQ (UPF0313 family)
MEFFMTEPLPEKTFKTNLEKSEGRCCTSGFLKLPPGRYTFVVDYSILDNPSCDPSLLQAMVANWSTPKIFRGVDIPGKPCSPKETERRCTRLDFKLDQQEELECRLSMIGSGSVLVHSMRVMNRETNLSRGNPKVLFILEDRPDPTGCVHQGISSIAAYLRQHGIESRAVITSLCDDAFIEDAVSRYRFEYIAFSVLTGLQWAIHARIASLKAKFPQLKIIVGGPHITTTEEQMLNDNSQIDMAVVGEGEATCCDIMLGKPLSEIPGLIYRQGGQLVKAPPRPFFKSLDAVPAPVRDIYLTDEWQTHSLLTSRGCPYKCHFCSSSRIWASKLRFRPLSQIDAELKWMYDHGDHSLLVGINDDMFNLIKQRTMELTAILRKYPFRYYARGVRADKIDAETAKAMKEAGITGCGVGVESADNESLRLMSKNETIEEIERGINFLRENGILTAGQFIIGNIGDTLETVKKSVEFAKKLSGATFYSAALFPGTPLTEYVVSNNYQLPEPYFVTDDSPSTAIFFETPIFPLKDRITAVRLAYDAGFIHRFPTTHAKAV